MGHHHEALLENKKREPLHMLAAFHYWEKKLAIFIWFMGSCQSPCSCRQDLHWMGKSVRCFLVFYFSCLTQTDGGC
ncbi:unnamed protein product [Urochloa humidicola]